MKYKVGDRVRIKSLDWYNENKNHCGEIPLFKPSGLFVPDMSRYCNNIMTIKDICYGTCYRMKEDFWHYNWTDEMIEGLVEEETKPKFKVGDKVKDKNNRVWFIVQVGKTFFDISRVPNASDGSDVSGYFVPIDDQDDYELVPQNDIEMNGIKLDTGYDYLKHEISLPDGYIFKDENGNVINATKIVLEKKKKEYPKTYEECLSVLKIKGYDIVTYVPSWTAYEKALYQKVLKLRELVICRDAYWKIAGDEMGLGKPWEPDYDSGVNKYGIICLNGVVQESNPTTNWERHLNKVLDFPTEEMRDAFKENFDPDLEICKEFL